MELDVLSALALPLVETGMPSAAAECLLSSGAHGSPWALPAWLCVGFYSCELHPCGDLLELSWGVTELLTLPTFQVTSTLLGGS